MRSKRSCLHPSLLGNCYLRLGEAQPPAAYSLGDGCPGLFVLQEGRASGALAPSITVTIYHLRSSGCVPAPYTVRTEGNAEGRAMLSPLQHQLLLSHRGMVSACLLPSDLRMSPWEIQGEPATHGRAWHKLGMAVNHQKTTPPNTMWKGRRPFLGVCAPGPSSPPLS